VSLSDSAQVWTSSTAATSARMLPGMLAPDSARPSRSRLGAYLGHALGDTSGQSRFPTEPSACRPTCANARDLHLSKCHTVMACKGSGVQIPSAPPRAPAFSRFVPLVQSSHMTHEREATLVGQVKEPERRVNRTGHLVHFERTPGPCLPTRTDAQSIRASRDGQGRTLIARNHEVRATPRHEPRHYQLPTQPHTRSP